ncbi:hypothetical protein ACLM45_08140 [Synechococcus sp. A10-1-5-9]|uniref:hypothetical protein n=1 Tax=Synechococcus sp. A10-1-5-9 TaxID=3392295 RepID=UPI0039EB68CE
MKGRVLSPELVKERAQRNAFGYTSSAAAEILVCRPQRSKKQASRFFKEQSGASLFLSNEGWAQAFSLPGFCEEINDLIEVCSPIKTTMIVVVRPPVEWINSAWWQWGAWQSEPNFERWFPVMLKSLQWHYKLNIVKERFPKVDLRVLLLKPTLLTDLAMLCGLEATAFASVGSVANSSLPAVVLRLYQAFPELRPGPHASGIDFSILRALNDHSTAFRRAPWVINRELIQQILTQTKTSSQALTAWMSEQDAADFKQDPRWWSSDAYQDREYEHPQIQGHSFDLAKYAKVITIAYRELHLQSLATTQEATPGSRPRASCSLGSN